MAVRADLRFSLSALFLATGLAVSCGRAPEVRPAPAPRPELPSVPSGFVMTSYQMAMSEEMQKSYGQADEIMIGIFSGIFKEGKGPSIYYFSDFSLFDKRTFSWSPPFDVIVQVQADPCLPEIIRPQEFKQLLPLDRTGICWDFYEGRRSVYLVEGQKNLIFLKVGLDEASNESVRSLLDAYPVTRECRAADVFNLMIHHLVEGGKEIGAKGLKE